MKQLGKSVLIALAVLCVMIFAACGPAFDYDEAAFTDKAKEVIANINSGDYQAVYDVMTQELQAALPPEALEASVAPVLEASGGFVAVKEVKTAGITQKGVDYVTVVAVCDYDSAARKYTITFTLDMELGGLYLA